MNLKRGINLGGYLSQCDYSKEHLASFIHKEDLDRIAEMGFDHVRVPVDYNILETEDGTPIESGYELLDRVTDWCRENKLNMILDMHKVYGYDFNDAGTMENSLFKSPALMDRFLALWRRLAKRYGNKDFMAFELLNEIVEEDVAEAWNDLIIRAVREIRQYAPTTPIIYGGIQWNSARTVRFLRKPEDENIIFTFHFYEPLLFTHQKAYWVAAMDPNKEISYPATMEYYRENSKVLGYQGNVAVNAHAGEMGPKFMEELIADAVDAAKKAGVSLYCGEFGVIDRAPVMDTLRWFKDVNDVFRKYDIGFSVWTYKEKDFGITGEHYKPILQELINIWNR